MPSGSFVETARRGQIVQAAIETIAEVGYARASFTRIARRAGISPSLISYHFDSRDELMNQIVFHVNDKLDATLSAAAEGAPSSTEALQILVATQVRHFASHLTDLVALNEIYTSARDANGQLRHGDWRAAARAEFEAFLREGEQAGEFRPGCAPVAALALLAALEAVPAHLSAGADAERLAGELATLFVQAVKR